MAGKLTTAHVREFLSDYANTNLLLDREEFSNSYIELCMDLAVSEYNAISPPSNVTADNFPYKSIHLLGTCWQMYLGRAALMARNHLSYSDGGLQIPVEEKYELYKNLADTYKVQFQEVAMRAKIALNMADGWGQIRSDESVFPLW